MDYELKIKNRQKANFQILERLRREIKQNPDLRFGQILRNIGVVRNVDAVIIDSDGFRDERLLWYNEFYTESVDTLERLEK